MDSGRGIWWLASFPKSGNTWVRAFLVSLISGRPVDINSMTELGGVIASARNLIDDFLGIESADLTDEQQMNIRPRAYEVMAADSGQPFCLKVHDRYGLTPSGDPLFPTAVTRGAVYIVRNPLDVAVSLSHYRGVSVTDAVEIMLKQEARLGGRSGRLDHQFPQSVGNWASHLDSWLAAPFPVHLVRYEDLLAHPEESFGMIVRFMGRTESRDEIARAVEHSSFSRLQAQEAAVGFSASSPHSRFFRRGVAGAWRDELPVGQADRIVNAFEPSMRWLDYWPAAPGSASGSPQESNLN